MGENLCPNPKMDGDHMPKMPVKTLFLSCVTNEFGSYRAILSDHLTETGEIAVERQETFRARGEGTLILLDEYIKACDYVIHIVGAQTGACTSPADRQILLERYDYSLLKERLGLTKEDVDEMSYTQWEAWLAVLHRRRLFICTPTAEAVRDFKLTGGEAELQESRQRRHLKLLELQGRYAEHSLRFADQNSLTVGILKALRPLQGRVENENVVPKGLLQFDENAAGFYLDLMPPPYYQIGSRTIPEIVQHWKQFFESEPSIGSVGVLLGPSGSGKSSLFRAGVGPLLYRTSGGKFIETIYIQATAQDFENKLLNLLRTHLNIAELENCSSLEDYMQGYYGLPNSQKKKLVIVIDQFEQWLLLWNRQQDAELVRTIKQNRSSLVQFMLIVRDDFWRYAHNFMDVIGEELTPKNHRSHQLFDLPHSKKVLQLFGQAYQRVDPTPTPQQQEFIERAVAGLANQNRNEVICLRLSLFAFMMRTRAWNMETWNDVGGVKGLGVKFLEDTIGRSSEARFAKYRDGAKEVLRFLLPDRGSDDVRRQLSASELRKQIGYDDKPVEFLELLKVLHKELRIITLSDGESSADMESSIATSSSDAQYYQLAHDFLVSAVREWLSLTQKSTRSGRAMLLLENRSIAWHLDNRRSGALPSMREYCDIRWQTKPHAWTDSQREMMRAARRMFMTKMSAAVAVMSVALIAIGVVTYNLRKQAAKDAIASLIGTPYSRIEDRLRSLDQYIYFGVPMLREAVAEGKFSSSDEMKDKRIKCELALLAHGEGDRDFLLSVMLDPGTGLNCYQAIRRTFETREIKIDSELATRIANEWNPATFCRILLIGDEQFQLTQARRDPRKTAQMLASVPFQDMALLNEGLSTTTVSTIRSELVSIYQAETSDAVLRSGVAFILASCLPNDSVGDATRSCLLMSADSRKSFAFALQSVSGRATSLQLAKELMQIRAKLRDKSWKGEQRAEGQAKLDQAWSDAGFDSDFSASQAEQLDAAAVVGLAVLGEYEELWKLLREERSYSLRCQAINLMTEFGINRGTLINKVCEAYAAPETLPNEFEVAALLLALGSNVEHLPKLDQQRLVDTLVAKVMVTDSPYVLSSGEWLLRQLQIPQPKLQLAVSSTGRSYINAFGQRFAKVNTEDAIYQSLLSRKNNTTKFRKIVIDEGMPVRPFWCAVHEVTVAQWKAYAEARGVTVELPVNFWKNPIYPTMNDNCPMGGIRRRDALEYCNWLSEIEGLKPFYTPDSRGFAYGYRFNMTNGYRLPLDYEWELASRAGCDLLRFFGGSDALLGQYVHCNKPAETGLFNEVGTLMPNTLGLFDTLGNAMEWVHNPVAMKSQSYLAGMQLRGGAYLIHPPNIDHQTSKERKIDQNSSEVGDWVDGIRLVRWVN